MLRWSRPTVASFDATHDVWLFSMVWTSASSTGTVLRMEGSPSGGLSSSQPGGDLSQASIRKSAFESELKILLAGSPYPSLEAFEDACSKFQRDGFSSLTRSNTGNHPKTAKGFLSYRCEKSRDEDKNVKCGFTILVRRKEGGVYFVSLGNNGITEHKHQNLQGPTRLTTVLVNALQEKIREQGANGNFGLDAQLTVVKEMWEENQTVVGSRAYNRLRLQIEKSQFNTVMYKGLANAGELTLKIGESEKLFQLDKMDPDLAAVIGVLRLTQNQYPTAYINIGFANNVLCYIFISLPRQRQWGAKWSDLVQLDDKHGFCVLGMHIACWIVTSPENKNYPAAFVIMDRNSLSNWQNFVEDAKKAFTCAEKNGLLRKVETVISDEAGCIATAVETGLGVVRDRCYFHYLQRLRTQYRSHLDKVQPILDTMSNLLQKDQPYNVQKWCNEMDQQISALPNGDLKGDLRQMQQEVRQRNMAGLRRFTNLKNSQSGSESQNSVLAKLKIGSGVPLYSAMKTVVEYSEVKSLREEAPRKPHNQKMAQLEAEVLGVLSNAVSAHAMECLRENYAEGLNYTILVRKHTIPESQWKVTRIGARPETGVFVTRTFDQTSGIVIWECQSGCVAKGLPCRHIMAAARLQAVQGGDSRSLPLNTINTRWFRADLQRDLVLPNQSPLLIGGTALGVRPLESFLAEHAVEKGEVSNSNSKQDWEDDLEWEQDLRDVHDVPNQGSEEERPVRVVGGQPAPIPLKPHEIESAMCEQFYQVKRLCAHNPEKMLAFTNVMKSFEDELAPKPLVPSLPPTAKAPGRPQTARIKPGDAAKKMAKGKKAEYRLKQPVVKPRHNGKRIRGPTHCRRCGKPGHNASTCKAKRQRHDDE